MLYFPQELFHCIVDLFQDDPRTLASVRLVSRPWNISAKPHLFRSLDLLISEPPVASRSTGASFHRSKVKYRGVQKFKSLLSILDSISHCVRQVSLGRTTTFSSTNPENHNQQNTYALLLSSILSRFTHLSDIVFREIDWATLTPSFSSCILQICKSPTLERIEIWNCQMPTASSLLDFLRASRNVKSLRLSYFKILDLGFDAGHNKLAPSAAAGRNRVIARPYDTEQCTSLLHCLAVDAAQDAYVLENLFGMRPRPINFLKLRRLYLGNVNDMAGVAEFLQTAGHSLEFLDMRLNPSKQIQSKVSAVDLGLSHCPHLLHLRVSGLHWTPALCPSDYLSSLFTNIPVQSPIECLQLVVTVIKPKAMTPVGFIPVSPSDAVSASRPILSRPTELQYSDWSVLDAILSSPTFHALRSFKILLKTIREREVNPSRLSDMFPKLKHNGVQVTVS